MDMSRAEQSRAVCACVPFELLRRAVPFFSTSDQHHIYTHTHNDERGALCAADALHGSEQCSKGAGKPMAAVISEGGASRQWRTKAASQERATNGGEGKAEMDGMGWCSSCCGCGVRSLKHGRRPTSSSQARTPRQNRNSLRRRPSGQRYLYVQAVQETAYGQRAHTPSLLRD